MRFVVMTFMYRHWADGNEGSHEELLRIISDAGADGIEAFTNHFIDNKSLIKLYQQQLDINNLAMPVMEVIANLSCTDKRQREEAYEIMRRGIDVCDIFNVETIHLAGCHLPDGMLPADGRKWIAEGISDFTDDIEKRGMKLAFENYDPSPELICSAADCLDILQQADPRTGFIFDTGNFIAVNERAEVNFEKLFPYIVHIHCKDFSVDENNNPTGTQFGSGVINNYEIIRMLKERGYKGWLALESYLIGRAPKEIIPNELSILKSLYNTHLEV